MKMKTINYTLKTKQLRTKQICKRCIYDSNVPNISFDQSGICNYCRLIEQLEHEYGTKTELGAAKLASVVEEIKRKGKDKKYDCVVGVSGGTDSSYLLHLAVKFGLRPLAVHYDNTWNTSTATENIKKVTAKLNVDLYTYVVDNKEIDDIIRSFFFAGVPELDGPTDIALAEVLYRVAARFNVTYILEGHSFQAEGVSPIGTMYIDGRYIRTIHKEFGKIKMKTFPNMPLHRFLYWILFRRIKKIRPLWYVRYSKDEARKLLSNLYGWEYYGGHHLENRITAFHHTVYQPQRFKIDQRNNSLSAAVRSGLMSREAALLEYEKPIVPDPELIAYFKKRLGLSDSQYQLAMEAPLKYFWHYKTYKRTFEKLRPMFYVLQKFNLVPKSFYIKYCFPVLNNPR